MMDDYTIYENSNIEIFDCIPPNDITLMMAMARSSDAQKTMASTIVFGMPDEELDHAETMLNMAISEDNKVSDVTLLNYLMTFLERKRISLLDLTKLIYMPTEYVVNFQEIMKHADNIPTSDELETWFEND